MISMIFSTKYTETLKKIIVEAKEQHNLLQGFQNDIYMKMLWLLLLHSTPLNQVGEGLTINLIFQVRRNMGLW